VLPARQRRPPRSPGLCDLQYRPSIGRARRSAYATWSWAASPARHLLGPPTISCHASERPSRAPNIRR